MRDALSSLRLSPDALHFLLTLWEVIQGMDDWVDGDDVPLDQKYACIWAACVTLPGHPFLQTNSGVLLPVMANAALKWRAAESIERSTDVESLPKSYMLRASFYDVVLQVVLLVHGPEEAGAMAGDVMRLYGETYSEYRQEMASA